MEKREFQGKTALITGGSRGIGRAFALELAKNGANIVINYCGNDRAAQSTKQEAEKFGITCTLAKADLTDVNCAQKIYASCPKADILVLNASIQYRTPWEQITPEECDTQLSCNFRAPLLLIQKYAPLMRGQGWGRIITVGSVQEIKPHPDMLVYSSSKAALTAMMKSLALQLAPYGVTVNAIAPGVVRTDRNAEALSDPIYEKQVIGSIPVQFCAQPEDCLSALRFLCSEASRYVTGQNIFVDGGKSIE